MVYITIITMLLAFALAMVCACDFQVYLSAAQHGRKINLPSNTVERFEGMARKVRNYGLAAMTIAILNALWLARILGDRA